MKIHQRVLDLLTLADQDRVERALLGLQMGDLVVHLTGSDFGIITASVHSKDNKSYAVLIDARGISCTCPDYYYRHQNGKGIVACKHGIATIIHCQALPAEIQMDHFTRKIV